MGGIKDREAKKKAAKVFSRGGGGGTKGPAVLDKRNQELACPHCDRVFKQAQRYREHIANKHPDAADGAGDGASTSGAADGAPPPPPKPAVMDVGAKAGFYTHKSAKQLLLEWAQAGKKIKPRYRARAAPDDPDRHTAKVVLPGAAPGGKDDVVAFTPKDVSYATAAEAEQAAAVAGLHAVAGDRAMHRVLPPEHRDLWDALGVAAAARAERNAKREAATAARAERERRSAAAEARRAPTRVVMTDGQRDGVAAALVAVREVRGAAPVASSAADVASIVARLRSLGFAATDASAAAAAAPTSLDAALDWACLHVDEARLPRAFGPGAAGGAVGVIVNAAGGRTDAAGRGGGGTSDAASVDPAVAALVAWGYRQADAVAALQAERGDEEDAHAALYEEMTATAGGGDDAAAADADDDDDPATAADEEMQALAAIYGDDVNVEPWPRSPGGSIVTLTLPIDDGPPPLLLRAWLPPAYPAAPPARVGVVRNGTPPARLRAVTRALAAEAAGAGGGACVHGLAATALALVGEEGDGSLPLSPHASEPAVASASGTAAADAAEGLLHGGPARPHAPTSRKRAPPPPPDPRESARLAADARALAASTDPKTVAMRRARAGLPAARQRRELLAAVAAARVVMVAGETGCGKSTQVPQYLLEDAVASNKGAAACILVAQPRRVAAVGLATRVAAERGERVGDVVGYSVRLDTRVSARTRVTFCTTGVLLRRLLDGGGGGAAGLAGVSHIIIDEVHERSVDTDLALWLLQRALTAQPGAPTRVVLMSATADAATFCRYFGGVVSGGGATATAVPVIAIPGFTHPVRDLYLEDALEATGVAVGRGSRYAKKKEGKESAATAAAALASPYSEATLRSLAIVDDSIINYDLVAALVAHVLAAEAKGGPAALLAGWADAPDPLPSPGGPAGAVLVFMPGAPEIGRAVRAIEECRGVRAALGGAPLVCVPLHGGLPPEAQARAFNRPPPGGRKVVVATNVAETSVTIDDVTVVIDCGRVKEMAHDPAAGIGRLTEGWVSRASAKQRRGRAGRVRPGVCYKLFSRRTEAHKMAADTAPEVARAPLEPLCLSLRSALPLEVSLATAASQLVTPPTPDALRGAVATLTRLGALEPSTEALTPLGRLLARLPMDPRLAKALVYACLLRCAGPVLTVAAVLSTGRPLFVAPPDKRAAADAARARLCPTAAAAKSDHVAIVEAYNAWDGVAGREGRGAARALAADCFVSDGALDAARSARADLARSLADMGLLPASYVGDCRRWGAAAAAVAAAIAASDADPASASTSPSPDAASHSARVVKAALCVGFAPAGLLRVEAPPPKFTAGLGGAVEVDPDPATLRFRDEKGARVFLHPSSLLFTCGRFESGWLVASGVVAVGAKPSARLVSAAPAYAVLLFGGALTVRHAAGEIVMDGWARFKAPARIGVLVRELRGAADDALRAALERREGGGGGDLAVGDARVVAALHRLLETDGF